MTSSLEGKRIALAEGRQLEELVQMLEQEGAVASRYPMVSILDAPDEAPVVGWLRELIDGRFDYVVFFTGEGVRRLLGFADRANIRQEFLTALQGVRIVVRGPKPVRALKELALTPDITAPAPTTDGVIAALGKEPLQGKTVAVQMYAPANTPLEQFLNESGATMAGVLPYVYAPDVDADRVAELIRRTAQGEVDAVIFTSSPQVDRLYQVAEKRNLVMVLADGLNKVRVAAVGPVVADNLRRRSAPVHVCPEQGFVMKNLVKHIKADFD